MCSYLSEITHFVLCIVESMNTILQTKMQTNVLPTEHAQRHRPEGIAGYVLI